MNPLVRISRRLLLLAPLVMAGCAQPVRQIEPDQASSASWRGRLALKIESEPPQSFFAGFELGGQAQRGELFLFGPLGNTVSRMRWAPRFATLQSNGETRHFDSLDDLATQALGTDIPIAALFQWLSGQSLEADGWQADLSQLSDGRLSARRTHPAPPAELRLILEP